MNVRPQVFERNKKLALQLAKENGGKLPHPWALIKGGHGSLYQYIRRHRDLFKHLQWDTAVQQDKDVSFNASIRAKHIAKAIKFVRDHKGKWPSNEWLEEHGFRKQAGYFTRYPDLIPKIRRKVKAEQNHKFQRKRKRKK